jgi:hypothetical protein
VSTSIRVRSRLPRLLARAQYAGDFLIFVQQMERALDGQGSCDSRSKYRVRRQPGLTACQSKDAIKHRFHTPHRDTKDMPFVGYGGGWARLVDRRRVLWEK